MLAKLPRWERIGMVLAAVLLATGLGLYVYRQATEPVTLTLAAGSLDGDAVRLASAVAARMSAVHAGVRLKVIDAENALGASQYFASGRADLAIVRSDIGDLSAARAVVLLTHGVVLVIAPSDSQITSMQELKGRTVGVVGGLVNRTLVQLLDKDYDLTPSKTRFRDLLPDEVRHALRTKEVDALLAVVPMSDRYIAMLRGFFPSDSKEPPNLIAIESAEAIAAVSRLYDSYDLPKGAIRGSPALPDDDLTTLRVPVHLVARNTLSADTVATLARAIMELRRELAGEFPLVGQISAPSTDKDANVPIHPGAAAYFEGDEKTFFDRYGDQIFYGTLLMGVVSSALAALWKFMAGAAPTPGGLPVDRLNDLTTRIRSARSEDELEQVEDEINAILRSELARLAKEDAEASALGVAVTRLEHLIEQRSRRLASQPAAATPAAS